jgi:branched-chain amino acid transport system ATP-binding protein
MLTVEGLKVRYGPIEALHGISFFVDRGAVVSLVGSNGAGKTTTLNAVSGLLPVADGRISFEGRSIHGLAPEAIVELGIVHVPEGRRIFRRMTVWENLDLGAFTRIRDRDVCRDLERVYRLFPILLERRDQLAGSLSGGEQQMLAIGRGLMARPKLLMLDEPSMGLAPLMTQKIFEVLLEINGAGTTILLVEQNARAALRLASRSYVLETGVVTLSGSGAELLDDERVRKTYLGEV